MARGRPPGVRANSVVAARLQRSQRTATGVRQRIQRPARPVRSSRVLPTIQPAGRRPPAGRRVVIIPSDSEDEEESYFEAPSAGSSPGGGLDDSVEMDDSRLNISNNQYVEDSFVVHDDDGEAESSEDDDNLSMDSNDGSLPYDDGLDRDNQEIIFRRPPPPLESEDDDMSDIESVDSSADSSVAEDPDVSMAPDVIRSSEHGHCTICFEDAPYDPMGCLMCRQLIGCKRCVDKWFRTGQKKKEKREENAENHFMCPLCRHPWEAQPEIDSIFVLD